MDSKTKIKVLLVITILFACILVSCKQESASDSEIKSFELPELLLAEDGTPVRTAEQWQAGRRGEVLELFREYVYGKVPDVNPEIRYVVTFSDDHALCGTAKMKEVDMQITWKGDTVSVSMLIYLPCGVETPVPLFLGLNFYGNHTIHMDRNISLTRNYLRNKPEYCIFDHKATEKSRGVGAFRWPVERILARGYGLATIYYGDLDPDFDDGFKNGIHGLLDIHDLPRDSSAWGSISAWAWGLSRAMDYFEEDPDIDHQKVALTGHSRLGKTALWAGARDERFALVISNNSGCGGAALSRRKSGERLTDINTSFPHWFAGRFHSYNDREQDLPVDQHMLMALIAPRPLYVASAKNDDWADPTGEYLSLFYSAEVYRLFGFDVPESRELPGVNEPMHAGRQAYHIRSGNHGIVRYDWENYLDFADEQFRLK